MLDRLRAIRYPASVIPAFLLWAAFPPMGEATDVFFALAPLMFIGRGGKVRRSVLVWTVNGLCFWLLTLSWFPAIVKNGGPWPLVVLGWFALSVYCSLYFGAYGYLTARYWRWQRGLDGRLAVATRFAGILAVEPVLWCGLEIVRSRLLGGFAWNQLGVAPVNAGFGAPAAIGGVYLVSAIVMLVNGTLAGVAERLCAACRREPMSHWRSLETLVPVLLALGVYELSPRPPAEEGEPAAEPLRVALVQRNFPCCFSGEWEDPIQEYSALLANVAPIRPSLVILPESAMAEFGQVDSPRAIAAAEWLMAKTGAQDVIAGGNRNADSKFYNAAALYRRGVRLAEDDIYHKVHLVPFGEFIPLDKTFPILQKLAPLNSCTPGEPRLLDGFGIAICFEDTDSALMRKYAGMGAKALVFITNDSWFSHSVEAEQHAWQARARAIETGLTVLRAGNSGVTGTVTPDGAATWLTDASGAPLVDRGAAMVEVVRPAAAGKAPTPYVRLGDWPMLLAFALVLAGMSAAIARGGCDIICQS